MGKGKQAPLRENEHVQELLAIMKENQIDTRDLRELLGYVGAMERQLDAAVTELQGMRRELNDMREEQNHPARTALRSAAQSLEGTVNESRERLAAIKDSIIEGCKNAVAAFKEKGISALNHIAGFFGIKDGLQKLRDSLSRGIGENEKAIAKIEAASAEYHKAGNSMRNMVRTMRGQDAVEDVKPAGKLAKLLESPFRTELSCQQSAKKLAKAAIARLERLEQSAEKPSVLKALRENKKTPKQDADAPDVDKQKRVEPSL